MGVFDISQTGIRLALQCELAVRQEVTLSLESIEHPVRSALRVTWSGAGPMGPLAGRYPAPEMAGLPRLPPVDPRTC